LTALTRRIGVGGSVDKEAAMNARRAVFALFRAIPLVLVVLSTPAAATGPPTTATGSFTQLTHDLSNERIAGGVFLFDFTETDSFSGISVIEGSCVVTRLGKHLSRD
jgi:hypothetical protein